MNKPRRNKLKGTILFTVVSVMALMIVFLMSTLVLATSASNRASRSYTSSQASYTARTAVDSIVAAVQSDTSFAASIFNLTESSPDVEINVDLPDSLASMGKVSSVKASYVKTEEYYNSEKKQWEPKSVVKVTAVGELAGEKSTTSLYFIVDPSKPIINNGAEFFTGNKAMMANNQTIFGGAYIGMHEYFPNILDADGNPTRYDEAVYDFNTRNYLNNAIYEFKENGVRIEADTIINGNVEVKSGSGFIYTSIGKGVSIWGNLQMNNGGELIMSEYANFDAYTTPINYKDVPYLYVDGRITNASNVDINRNNRMPLNIFCGSFHFIENPVNISADIYCMDAGVRSEFQSTSTNLYNWVDALANKVESTNGSYSGGNIYTKGDLLLRNVTIRGDVRVEGSAIIGANVKILGDLVVKGNLNVESSNIDMVYGNVYCDLNNNNIISDSRDIRRPKTGYTSVKNTLLVNAVKFGYVDVPNIPANVMEVPNIVSYNEPAFLEEYLAERNPEAGWAITGKYGEHIGWNHELGGDTFTIYYYEDAPGKYYKEPFTYNIIDSQTGMRTGEGTYDEFSYLVSDAYGNVAYNVPVYQLNPDGSVFMDASTGWQPVIIDHAPEVTTEAFSYYIIDPNGFPTDMLATAEQQYYASDIYGNIAYDLPIYQLNPDGSIFMDESTGWKPVVIGYDYGFTTDEISYYRYDYNLEGLQGTLEFDESVTRVDADSKIGSYYVDATGNLTSNAEGELSNQDDIGLEYYYYDPNGIQVTEAMAISSVDRNIKSIADYSNDIYPPEMEKKAILGIVEAGSTLDHSKTKFIHTVKSKIEELDFYAQDQNVYEIPVGKVPTKTLYDFPEVDGNRVINESVKITGGWNGNLILDPANGTELWVEIDGNISLGNNKGIIFKDIDEHGNKKSSDTKVYIFMKKNSKLTFYGGYKGVMIGPQSLIDAVSTNTPLNIVTIDGVSQSNVPANAVNVSNPNIYVYSESDFETVAGKLVAKEPAEANMAQIVSTNMHAAIFANVKAPYLILDMGNTIEFKTDVYYNNVKVNGLSSATRLGSIGCINVYKASMHNNTACLYVPDSSGTVVIGDPSKNFKFQLLYYEQY